MAKSKAGLHKDVSAIFKGVPLPGDEGKGKGPGAAAPEGPKPETPLKLPAERPQRSSAYKPAAPSHMTPTKPKPALPVEPPPQPEPPKVTKPETAKKPEKFKKPVEKVAGPRPWEKITSKLMTPKAGVSAGRQKAMVLLVPILFIMMIFVFTRVFSTSSHVVAQPAGSGPTGTVAGPKGIDWQIPEPYPENLRDPMQIGSTGTTEVQTSDLVVKGIVFSEDKPSAVIGNEIVYEGEEIRGATVVKINSDSVVFKMNDKEWTQEVER